jgi:hypothetical protein
MRPGVRPRSGDADHVRKPEHRELPGVVAGPADLANHGAGGSSDAAVSMTIPELNSEQGALPDRRGWYRERRRVSAHVGLSIPMDLEPDGRRIKS